jgi:UDP-N-acetylglucosamine 1-carboxyvinyltransferase
MPDVPAEAVLKVSGGRPLHGRYRVQGSKNAALHLIAAALLSDGPVTVRRAPDIVDLFTYERLLGHAGWHAEMDRNRSTFSVDLRQPSCVVHPVLGGLVRTTPILAAAMLSRTGRVTWPRLAGGDAFCPRPTDRHEAAIRAAGATIESGATSLTATLPIVRRAFRVDVATLYGASRGATVTALLLAARARGTSLITNPSNEPEIRATVSFLAKRGVLVDQDAEGLHVTGADWIAGGEVALPGDRDEAATVICATAATGGEVGLDGIGLDELTAGLTNALSRTGITISPDGTHSVEAKAAGPLTGTDAVTGEGLLPSNAGPPLAALLTQACGDSVITEGVYPSRDTHVGPLSRFGARIASDGPVIRVRGGTQLRAADATVGDIRGAAAVLIAALAAPGTSHLHVGHPVWRGYQGLTSGLRALGADLVVKRQEG